jgi:hypothetical protein
MITYSAPLFRHLVLAPLRNYSSPAPRWDRLTSHLNSFTAPGSLSIHFIGDERLSLSATP